MPDALSSVALQTYRPVEHIVKDGGSVDGSVDVLRQSRGVIWHSARDSGQSAALNEAFSQSHGEIIGWLNADDAYFHRRVVERVVTEFKAHPNIDVIYGHAVLINADGLILHFLWSPPFNLRLLRIYNYICQPTVFMRRAVVADSFINENFHYSMDRELWLRLSERATFARVGDVLAVERHHRGRKSHLRADLAKHDRLLLERAYGVPLPERSALRIRLCKIATRIAGVSLVGKDLSEIAFPGHFDGRTRVAMRQVAQLRAWMPTATEME